MGGDTSFKVAARLRDRGLKVATVWPDCSDRYVSMSLEPPGVASATCPLKSRCASRWESVIEQ